MKQNSIAKKIAQIIAKAESSQYEGEAQVLMEKARKLMDEHGLEIVDVNEAGEANPRGGEKGVLFANELWERKLINSVARYYGCDVVFMQQMEGTRCRPVAMYGRLNARITTKLMLPFIMSQITKEAVAAVKNGEYRSINVARREIALALVLKIRKHYPRQMEDMSDLMRADFGHIAKRNFRSSAVSDNAHARAGNISLARQAEGSAGVRAIAK